MDQWKRKIEDYLELLYLIKFTLFLFFSFWLSFSLLIAHSSKWNRGYAD
jgi:hypothetical protein